LAVSVGVSALLLWVLRAMLAMENKRRDSENRDETYDNVYITHVNADGTTEEKKVDKVRLCDCFSVSDIDLSSGILGPHRCPKQGL
jgi:hypothetical protein